MGFGVVGGTSGAVRSSGAASYSTEGGFVFVELGSSPGATAPGATRRPFGGGQTQA